MISEVRPDSGRRAFLRFGLSGVVFTILGPGLFWLAYPLGPFVAVAVAELTAHALRFLTFRTLVFPAHRGYRVSLPRYVISALPVSITGVLTVALLRNRLDRTALTLTGALIAVVVGFVWSRYVYSRPVAQQARQKQAQSGG
jgi:putative flippase GtrA